MYAKGNTAHFMLNALRGVLLLLRKSTKKTKEFNGFGCKNVIIGNVL